MENKLDPQSPSNRLDTVEKSIREINDRVNKVSAITSNMQAALMSQEQTLFGITMAICVDTKDPLKQNRVRFFSPVLYKKNLRIKQLDFARPVSNMGGFDDCGLMWVPPVGSKLILLFEHGDRTSPFYIGTTWVRDIGPEGKHYFPIPIPEYQEIHEGHRKGYLIGPNDGSQFLPSWNTESYNGIDITSKTDFNPNPDAEKRTTYPNIYGFKTPEKHMVKLVDGDHKCNHKNKRLEILSSCGNWLIFKDDHLHDFSPTPDEGVCPDTTAPTCKSPASVKINFFKHKNELRPFNGPQTPQNNKLSLKQSGIQILSISGHTFLMDDSVEQPQEIPNWERSTLPFNFGCNDKYIGKTSWVSATGHRIEMSDVESRTHVRGGDNYIRFLSAAGNKIEMNDHSLNENVAGENRGIRLQSTSNHTIEMVDDGNEQTIPQRKEGGQPTPKSKRAYVRIRTGYGLTIEMKDANSQEKTEKQSITIFSPQKDNKERGPHVMSFTETSSGPGQVLLRVGGNLEISTYDNFVTQVGDDKKNPSNYLVNVTKNTIISTKESYANIARDHRFVAEKAIMLLAGKDCPVPNSDEKGPCQWPVLVMSDKGVVASDRVFASASPDSPKISIMQLTPLHR